jgi:hypothetical protein
MEMDQLFEDKDSLLKTSPTFQLSQAEAERDIVPHVPSEGSESFPQGLELALTTLGVELS